MRCSVLRGDARPVISDGDNNRALVNTRVDAHLASGGRVFEGIIHQVGKNLRQAVAIANQHG